MYSILVYCIPYIYSIEFWQDLPFLLGVEKISSNFLLTSDIDFQRVDAAINSEMGRLSGWDSFQPRPFNIDGAHRRDFAIKWTAYSKKNFLQ
jgi:hypothetical protein